MKISTNRLLLALLVGSALTGCKKYDDGPTFSLRSREERIANNWRIERAMEGGNDVTSAFEQYDLRLTKDGDASLTATYTVFGTDFSFTTNGTWSFENKDEDLRLDFEDDGADEVYQILRLKEKELWLREKGDDLELHLQPS